MTEAPDPARPDPETEPAAEDATGEEAPVETAPREPAPAQHPVAAQQAPTAPGAPPPEEALSSPLALIDLGEMTIAIAVRDLREVMVAPDRLQPLRSTRPGVIGCVALRGQVIPVIDLAPLIGQPPLHPDAAPGVVVIVGKAEEVYGIIARTARQIVPLREVTEQAITTDDQDLCDRLLPRVVLIGGHAIGVLDTTVLPQLGVPLSRGQRAQRPVRDAADHYLLFETGGIAFCLPLNVIETTLPEAEVDASVLASGPCDGGVTHQGTQRALLDLLPFLGMSPVNGGMHPPRASSVVLPYPEKGSLALRAEKVRDIRSLRRQAIGRMPSMLCSRPDMISGACVAEDGETLYVLNAEALLADPTLAELSRIAHRKDGRAAKDRQPRKDGKPPARFPRQAALLVQSGIRCAFALEQVTEILSVPEHLQRDLGAELFLGAIAARDRTLLPIFSLAAHFGHAATGKAPKAALVLVHHQGEPVGLLVEEICAIETLDVISGAAGAILRRPLDPDAPLWQMLTPDALALTAAGTLDLF
ncbi:chemotaxis protein CheW [Pseudooceanicola sp. CBS1P-1]|uniref:CheW-like domain-containing protein n=1 Tax=Pseudooceanicola albus TaxID=2692189 RepID=A0A6L7G2N7_9RHOB|nr:MULTISPECIES: chemotaxis protein CheW [Pseudooceanicola]MBT9382301.1 chemotaxis protein CheW [Pseudooceanicola endophyticus]MXN16843.1 hypothetical protein [Pseudooceanicola albus]